MKPLKLSNISKYLIKILVAINDIKNNLFLLKKQHNFPVCYPGAFFIKLITVIIYGFCNKLECFTLHSRLGWKGLPWTNTLAYYVRSKFYDTVGAVFTTFYFICYFLMGTVSQNVCLSQVFSALSYITL